MYLFFDFAGYSAFAIGGGYLFGIHSPENFRRPFLARDIRDFWNRWHMSLSWWFRDHVYMRFVMAATRGRWNKHHQVWRDGPVWHAAGVILTVQAVCFGFLIFSGHFKLPV